MKIRFMEIWKPLEFETYLFSNLEVIFETMLRHSTPSSFILISCDLYIKYN